MNITNGPTITGDGYHIVVRSLTVPDGDSIIGPYVPVRVTFDPVTLHTRTHTRSNAIPTVLNDALLYPYFLPVSLCENEGRCMTFFS